MQLEDYLAIEAALSKRLVKTWRPVGSKLHLQLIARISRGDFSGARQLVDSVDMSFVGTKNRAHITYLSQAAFSYGASVAAGFKDTLSTSSPQTAAMTAAVNQLSASVTLSGNHAVKEPLLRMISEAELTLKKAEKTKKDYLQEFVSFREDGDAMLQLISSLHTSRLTVYGFTAEADILGLTTYKLSAVLDSRTSEYCRIIDGKTFKVADARRKILEVLNVPTPDNLKTVQPWPSQTKANLAQIRTMSSEDLTSNGWHIPPFHPGCRTLCVPVDFSVSAPGRPTSEREVRELIPSYEVFPPENFKEIGVRVTPEEATLWGSLLNMAPATVLAKLSGSTLEELLTLKGIKRMLSFGRNQQIRLQVDRALGAGLASVRITLDTQSRRMLLERLDYKNVPPAVAVEHLLLVYRNAVEIGLAANVADALFVHAAGAMIAAHVKMGFLPSVSSWTSVSSQMLSGLTSGTIQLGLSASERVALVDLLTSNDPKKLLELISFERTSLGVPVHEILLKSVSLELSLKFSDGAAVTNVFGGSP